MAVLKRRQGVRNRRETDGIVKSFKAVKTVQEALEIVCELYVTENYRDRTINDYRKYWAEFMEVAGIMPSDNVTDITEDHLRSYITTMLNIRDLSPVTINIRLGGIKSILSRMTKRGLLNENPAKRVTKLRVDEKTIKMLRDSQVRRFFKMIDKDTFPGFRDYVAFLIALKCGLRSNELEGLKPEAPERENEYVISQSKLKFLQNTYAAFKSAVNTFVSDRRLTNKLYGIYLAHTLYLKGVYAADILQGIGLEAVRQTFIATKRKPICNLAGYYNGVLDRMLDRLLSDRFDDLVVT
ncbi:tyrosine-type recombinase/integrase [Bacillus sp. JK74]